MTYSRDYIIRQIEMIGQLIAAILGLLKKGQFDKAQEAIDQAYQDILKEDAALFRNIPMDKLTDELMKTHNYTHNHLEIIAELFYAEAELWKARKKFNHAVSNYQKSLLLFEFIEKESAVFSMDKMSKVDLIKAELEKMRN
jgi:tetratricopeptide (TPR) repeat protein